MSFRNEFKLEWIDSFSFVPIFFSPSRVYALIVLRWHLQEEVCHAKNEAYVIFQLR